MRKFWLFIKFHFQARLEYRGDMVVYGLASALAPLIGLALWLAASNFGSFPYSQLDIIAYFIAVIYVSIITDQWQSWYINKDINSGDFSRLLIKPISMLFNYITENLSDSIFKISVITVVAPIAYILIPREVWSQFAINPLNITLFIIAIVLGYCVMFLLEMSVGLLAVWLYDIDFIKQFLDLSFDILAGKFIPLAFLPAFLFNVAIFLPFRYAVSFPVEILLNKLTSDQLMMGFAIEGGWLVVSFLIYKLLRSSFDKAYKGYGA